MDPYRQGFAEAFAEVTGGERPIQLFRSLHAARRWLLEGGAHAEQEGEQVHVPDLDQPGDGQEAEHSGGRRERELRQRKQPPLRHPVGDQAAPGAKEQHRQELQRGGQADGDAGVGEAEDEPDRGDATDVYGRGGGVLGLAFADVWKETCDAR